MLPGRPVPCPVSAMAADRLLGLDRGSESGAPRLVAGSSAQRLVLPQEEQRHGNELNYQREHDEPRTCLGCWHADLGE